MDQTPFPAQNSSKQIFWCIWMEFFTGGSLMDYRLAFKPEIMVWVKQNNKLKCLNNFVSDKYAAFYFTECYFMNWSGVDRCDVFLSAVWTLNLTAPIHYHFFYLHFFWWVGVHLILSLTCIITVYISVFLNRTFKWGFGLYLLFFNLSFGRTVSVWMTQRCVLLNWMSTWFSKCYQVYIHGRLYRETDLVFSVFVTLK